MIPIPIIGNQKQKIPDPKNNKQMLFRLWDLRYNNRIESDKVFLGNVDNYQFKNVPNSEFILLKNQSRIKKRIDTISKKIIEPLIMCEQDKAKLPRPKVVIPLQESDFSFNKIFPQQVIKNIYSDMNIQFFSEQKQLNSLSKVTHPILINKIPMCPYHSLFVPWMNQLLPQKLTLQSILLVNKLILIYDDMVVGYTSVGAGASVNNLHFQIFFKQQLIGGYDLPLLNILHNDKQSQIQHVYQDENGRIDTFRTYYTHGFIFTTYNPYNTQQNISKLDRKISLLLEILIGQNIAHNAIFIRKKQLIQMFIIPRNYQTHGVTFGCIEHMGVFCMDYNHTNKQFILQKFTEIKFSHQQLNRISKILQQ